MREFQIQENDANQRLDKFIIKTMHTIPKALMYKYIRNKKIKVNRKRCEISQRLQTGDTVQCYISEEFFDQPYSYDFLEVSKDIQVIYEDKHFLIMDKPIGLLVQKDQKGIQDNLNDRLLHYLYDHQEYDPKQSQSFTPACAHRIDRNTQGLVLAGKSAEGLRTLNAWIKHHELRKYYLCIVEGSMEEQQGELHYYHDKDMGTNTAKISSTYHEGWAEIKSTYKVLKQGKQHSLLEVEIETGKSHQIRASLAYKKHPLLGDTKYGAKKVIDFPYQALCAYKVCFSFLSDHPTFHYMKDKEILLKDIQLLQYFNNCCCI